MSANIVQSLHDAADLIGYQESEIVKLRLELWDERIAKEHYIQTLAEIRALLYPPIFTSPEGFALAFRPKSVDPHEILQELSDRIRAVSEKIAAGAKS